MEKINENLIKNFLDSDGKIKAYSGKQSKIIPVLTYLSQEFSEETVYSEPEINEIISGKIIFKDYVTIRRDLVDFCFLSKSNDRKTYRRINQTKLITF